jgi:peptidoglycan-N-acetylglucosamine deacetylase
VPDRRGYARGVVEDTPVPTSTGLHRPPRVALTFDMEHPSRPHQDPAAPSRILDTLATRGVRATFFVQGRYARAFPDLARRVVSDGHLLGNHSHHHGRMSQLTDGGIRADVAAAHEALLEVTGQDARPWFRCPFGDGHDDERVLAGLADVGYRDVYWDVDSLDYLPSTDPATFAETVARLAGRAGDGAVVLCHTWPMVTGDQLGALLDSLAEAGAVPVGFDETG